ncbi:DUF1064 domain-containing protein [Lentilactobacillus kosonis]|uniref:Phage protein n=1 Tax=Lentilactobacillus kosonis TaxID=2810561 RepID=A0A401FPK5_9LACO|nr:DUF1064 domain-containing protein [Lentilactobacillus kosonis]GAY74246.1 phage protein [Lentilactobacillus kosonis]
MVKYPTGVKAITVKAKVAQSSKQKQKKYHNRPVEYDGHRFDSQVECGYYKQLKILKLDCRVHEKFELQPKFECGGVHHQSMTYKPDFSIYEQGKLVSVVDVKGGKATQTIASTMRMKMFMYRYKVPVVIATWNKETQTFEEKIK